MTQKKNVYFRVTFFTLYTHSRSNNASEFVSVFVFIDYSSAYLGFSFFCLTLTLSTQNYVVQKGLIHKA